MQKRTNKRSTAKLSDVISVVTGLDQTVAELGKDSSLTKSRVEILEKHIDEMKSLPATVSGLSIKVESLSESLKREVDGVREQNKAHKTELMEQLELNSSSLGNGIRTLSTQVGALLEKEKVTSTIKKFLLKIAAYIGGVLASAAAIAEIIRAFHGG